VKKQRGGRSFFNAEANNIANGTGSADIFILLNHQVINDMLLFCHTANTCHVETFHDKRIYLTPKENEYPASWRGRCMLTALQRLHPEGQLTCPRCLPFLSLIVVYILLSC
jgi:hypothetical protein